MAVDYGPADLPSIEELTGPGPWREPGWPDAQLRHQAGLADRPRPCPGLPNAAQESGSNSGYFAGRKATWI